MPACTRPASDPPTRTSSFVCEVPLRVSQAQERTLLARLEAARQVYNACLGEARTRARLVRESKAFQLARALHRDDPERKTLFAKARAQHAFSEYALHAYAQQFGHSWLGEHLDSLTVQKLATRAYGAANQLLVGKARRVRFKGKQQLDSMEGKTNTSGILWRGDHVAWGGLVLPARLDPRDPVQSHGLACPVKYVRLVRRKLGLRNRFYAQLVCEGVPYRKPQQVLGTGVVGLDLGPSAIAVVSAQEAVLQPFCSCGASAQRDLFSAYLARFVDPENSLLDVGQAQAAWPGWEPTLQAAYAQAISNQPARGRRLPVAFGRPPGVAPSQSGSLAEGLRSRT